MMAFWTVFTLWAGICSAIYFGFNRLADDMKPFAVARLRDFLNRSAERNWGEALYHLFERAFGERHLSWRCFRVCCAVSIIFITVASIPTLIDRPRYAIILVTLCFVVSIIPDYVSLAETRLIMRVLSKRRTSSPLSTALLIALDFGLTLAIAYCGWFVFFYGVGGSVQAVDEPGYAVESATLSHELAWQALSNGAVTYFADITAGTAPSTATARSAPLVLSAFLTSAWLWLFVVSVNVCRLFTLARFFRVDDKPVQTLGWISMAFVTILFLVSVAVF